MSIILPLDQLTGGHQCHVSFLVVLSPEDEPLINPTTSSWSSSGCWFQRDSKSVRAVNSVQHFHNCLSALSPERCDFSRTVKFEWNKSSSVWEEVWEHGDWQRHVLYLRENQTGIRPVSCSALLQLAPSFPPPNVTWLLAAGLGDSGTQRLWRFFYLDAAHEETSDLCDLCRRSWWCWCDVKVSRSFEASVHSDPLTNEFLILFTPHLSFLTRLTWSHRCVQVSLLSCFKVEVNFLSVACYMNSDINTHTEQC